MTEKNYIILGFGKAGALTQKSMDDAKALGLNVDYFELSGSLKILEKPNTIWSKIKSRLEGEDEAIVIWSGDSLIVWDRMTRAFAINHQPDFLWPLSLELHNGALKPVTTHLFKAVGAAEIALFGFRALHNFHHAVSARALYKLLSVTDPNTLTLAHYMMQAWDNFESVKAPDAWIIGHAGHDLNIASLGTISQAEQIFARNHSNWLMGREALEAQNRNTLSAADFCRTNIDIMGVVMDELMQALPYYGFWPIKAGQAGAMMQPVSGHHPAIAQIIWAGDYCKTAVDFFVSLFCKGAYKSIIDTRHDGHIFGLLFGKITGQKSDCYAPSIQLASNAQSAANCNNINVNIFIDKKIVPKKADVVIAELSDLENLMGTCDLFIPLSLMDDRSKITLPKPPKDYVCMVCDASKMSVDPLTINAQLAGAAALIILHKDHKKLGASS